MRNVLKGFCVGVSNKTKHHGEFWNKMRCLLPGKDRIKSKIVLIENNCVITDSLSVDEIFNIYSSEVAGNDGNRLEIADFKDRLCGQLRLPDDTKPFECVVKYKMRALAESHSSLTCFSLWSICTR